MAIEKITLAAARKNVGLTQEGLAKAVGASTSSVYKWENGLAEPSVTTAYKLADAVGLHIDDIIFLPTVAV